MGPRCVWLCRVFFFLGDIWPFQLHVVEIDHQAPDPPFTKRAVDVYFPPEATNDFPVAMQMSKKHGIVYLATKYGFIHLYDLESGACIYMNRISGETIFVTTEHEATNGILCINRKGQVLGVSVDEQTLVPYILTTLNNTELAFKLASRGNLPGADDLYIKQYQSLFQSGQFNEAAKIAANSPRVCLRLQSPPMYICLPVINRVYCAPRRLSSHSSRHQLPLGAFLLFFNTSVSFWRKGNSITSSLLSWRARSCSRVGNNSWKNGSRRTR
jgi:hypothetical protein